jgi:hypothetical protein
MTGTVHIVHAIDTEGPLYESLEAKFERLDDLFGIVGIEPTPGNLRRLQEGEIDLGDRTDAVRDMLRSHRANTLGTWTEIDQMLEVACSREFRHRYPDSQGRGWAYTWFCMDHIGYLENPRKRDIGHHNVHDHYVALVNRQTWARDSVEFHFHPMSTYRDAHRCATHYLRTEDLYQILCRRIIDRGFFPSSYRAGFQAERPDSHWFLEQFIPYDISNMATADTSDIDASIDFRNGRSGNWRKAPHDWTVYHPDHDDYQVPGRCRRLIGRALNLNSRIARMTQDEMDQGFARARNGEDVLIGLCSHDWRDLVPEVENAFRFLQEAKSRYPEVPFLYSSCRDAFRAQLPPDRAAEAPLAMSLRFQPEQPGRDVPYIEVRTEQGTVFGPQPFLAIKTRSRRYIHDNFDFDSSGRVWYYAFHGDTLPWSDVDTISVAANDMMGNTVVLRHENEDR